jgi:hypothetical protein
LQNLSNQLFRLSKYILLTCLFISSLSSNDAIFQNIKNQKLYENSYWAKLLHYTNDVSEIESNNFFISSSGKSDLKKELFDTINSLIKGENEVLCRFPLRVKWLKSKISNLDKNIVNYECKDLDTFIKSVNAKHVTLVFPSAHINSPASMYGHTFLRLTEDKNTPLLSNAVNYAAQTDESNGFLFAYKGIFGGYKGKYSILPYYKKLKEYSNLEQRDVWEYDLDFTKNQVNDIVLHTYELKDSYSDYFFFKENCSYNVLWLLEIAKPNLNLVDNFYAKTIPLDTIKLLKKLNLVKESKYRASKMSKMKYILNKKIKNKEYLRDYVNDKSELNDTLSSDDKMYYLDFKIEYMKYLRSKNKIDKSDYLARYIGLLKERSSFNKKSDINIKKPFNPINSHDSARVKILYSTKDDNVEIGYKPVYNDIYDVSKGYLQGAYINFFDFNILKNKDKIRLNRFTLLNIKSYAKRDMFFKPLSWGVDLGYKYFLNKDYFYLNPEIGYTFGNSNEFLYLMLGSKGFYKNTSNYYSYGGNIGIVSNRFEDMKLGIKYSYDKYNEDIENNVFEVFSTNKISKNTSFNIKYKSDNLSNNNKENVNISLFYYF